ncbi:MAG TPA: DUF4209 domain-containing protein [Candidatus Rifleibacterium sp.]|nr:DUF4209 domain-containing protein [Candidatus Rifleibacterium sp.]
MSDLLQKIDEVLLHFENESNPFDEHDVFAKMRACIPSGMTEISEEIRSDLIAFDFCENAEEHSPGWGLYFGPMMVLKNDDGTFSESPGKSFVTEQVITLWCQRAKQLNQPILKARYSGLVWVFAPLVNKRSPGVEFAQFTTDSIIKISQSSIYKREVYVSAKLTWALSLAQSIQDESRISQVVSAMVDYEEKIGQDDKPGLWGFSFDALLLNKNLNLSTELESKIVSDLEARLSRLANPVDPKNLHPWAAESAATRLAKYYQKKNLGNEVRRVLQEYSRCFQKMIDQASPIQSLIWTQQISKTFLDFGIRDESAKLLSKIKDIGPKVKDELKEFKFETKIPKEKIDKYLEEMLEGDLEKNFARLAFRFIPQKGEVENQLRENSKKFVFQHIIPQSILDHKGRTVAVIGTIDEDFPGHVIFQTSQSISIDGYFLRLVLDQIISQKKVTTKEFVDFIFSSPIFDETRKEILTNGIDAYLAGNYIASIHVLIPQIEEAIRTIIETSGGVVMKFNKNHWIQVKTFDELLRDPILTKVFGEDCTLYFRVLYTDSRGWNIRNNVCHGLSPIESFSQQVADRIVHSLLYLGMIRKSPTSA